MVAEHLQSHPMLPQAAEHAGRLRISLKDLILLVGGFFLIWKSTKEIHHQLEGHQENIQTSAAKTSFAAVLEHRA